MYGNMQCPFCFLETNPSSFASISSLCRHGDGFSSLCLIKERALDVLTISDHRTPLSQ